MRGLGEPQWFEGIRRGLTSQTNKDLFVLDSSMNEGPKINRAAVLLSTSSFNVRPFESSVCLLDLTDSPPWQATKYDKSSGAKEMRM